MRHSWEQRLAFGWQSGVWWRRGVVAEKVRSLAQRSKRWSGTRTGSRCGVCTQARLMQTCRRDAGKAMHGLSIPGFVDGRHCSGFRVGYAPQAT